MVVRYNVTSCSGDAGVTRDDYTATWFHATASPCCSDGVSSCNPALTNVLLAVRVPRPMTLLHLQMNAGHGCDATTTYCVMPVMQYPHQDRWINTTRDGKSSRQVNERDRPSLFRYHCKIIGVALIVVPWWMFFEAYVTPGGFTLSNIRRAFL